LDLVIFDYLQGHGNAFGVGIKASNVEEAKLRTIIEDVRKNGYSIVSEELEEGLESVSVPIHGKDGKVLAAANISAHASRVSIDQLQNEFLPKLQKSVKGIEKALAMQS
jgi:IclR family pca regulon transcriptional regulator